MTTPLEARTAITTKFNTTYGATTTVRWPNVSFEEPTDGSSWVSFDIVLGDAIATSISSKHNEQLGMVMINVFTKTLTGMIASTTLVQTVRAIFNRLTLSTIQFETPEIRPVTTDSDDLWYQVLVRIPFFYDETVT